MSGSWRTSLLGILLIMKAVISAGVALTDGDPATVVNEAEFTTNVMAGIALLMTRDNKVTSESLGLK